MLAAALAWVGGVSLKDVPQRLVRPSAWVGDVALVLSGDVENRRTLRAVALVKTGSVSRILISGAGAGGDSAVYLAAVAVNAGVSPGSIVVEGWARSTFENIVYSAPILETLGARRVVLVTSRRHARRAALIAEHHLGGMEIRVEVVPDSGEGAHLAAALSESAKLIVSAVRGWASLASLVRID